MFSFAIFQKTLHCAGIAVFVAALGSARLSAAVLDWNTTGAWTAGTPSTTAVNQNFAVAGAGTVNVAIQDSAAGAVWQNGSNGVSTVASPGVNNTLLTDHLTGQNALQLSLVSEPNATAFVTVTVTFSTPATNVSFLLWDVDKSTTGQQGNNTGNSYTDLISNITAKTPTNVTVNATSVVNGGSDGIDNSTTNATTVSGTQVTGGSPGGGVENDKLNSGQVAISFGSQSIKSYTFQWSNPGWVAASSQQFIALGNINYTPVPEFKPGLAALALCGGIATFGMVRERRRNSGLLPRAE